MTARRAVFEHDSGRHLLKGIDEQTGDRTLAAFSATRRHRYVLTREWEPMGRNLCFVGLNPSVGDEQRLDPTLRRVRSFAQREGFGMLTVVNLWSHVTPYPRELCRLGNLARTAWTDHYILHAVKVAHLTLLGWGTGGARRGRAADVLAALPPQQFWCLGLTKSREPIHPLYRRADEPFTPYIRSPQMTVDDFPEAFGASDPAQPGTTEVA